MTGVEVLLDGLHGIGNAVSSQIASQIGASFVGFVFLWAAVPKLRSPARAARAVADFGLARRPSGTVGAALGATELVLAVALLVPPTQEYALPLAGTILLVFSGLILRALLRGERFSCYCFGSESRLSRASLLRTVGLTAIAGVSLLGASHGEVVSWSQEAVFTTVAGLSLVGSALLGAALPAILKPEALQS